MNFGGGGRVTGPSLKVRPGRLTHVLPENDERDEEGTRDKKEGAELQGIREDTLRGTASFATKKGEGFRVAGVSVGEK